MAVLLALVVGATGIIEMFYYVPTPDQAALSVQTITYLVPFGNLVRNLHYWSAQLLVVVTAVHLVRIVFTGAYARPRRFNFILGLALLVTAIFLDFTGYVLRWDQGIQWALVVGTNLLRSIPGIGADLHVIVAGGADLGATTLVRFYAWHIFALALVFVVLTVWHIFRVRRDGGIAVPPPALRLDHERITRAELVRREMLAALVASAALLLLSVFWPAPIAAPIVSLTSVSPEARAPWFFVWVQQMLKWGDPFLFGIVAPLLVLGLLMGLALVFPQPAAAEIGRWLPRSNRLAQAALLIVVVAFLVLTILGSLPTG